MWLGHERLTGREVMPREDLGHPALAGSTYTSARQLLTQEAHVASQGTYSLWHYARKCILLTTAKRTNTDRTGPGAGAPPISSQTSRRRLPGVENRCTRYSAWHKRRASRV